jgi:carboxypeptidase PM20D1
MKKTFFAFLALFCILVGIISVRTIIFRSRQLDAPPLQKITLDRTAIVQRLSEAIQYRTITNQAATDPGKREFQSFHDFLAKSFPGVHERLQKETMGGHSLLFSWKGKDNALKPILLMAHMDVVPVDPATESSWRHPPFSGQMAEGYIWGRGTMDDKGSVLAILESAENLLASGFEPQRTIYLAFGHD